MRCDSLVGRPVVMWDTIGKFMQKREQWTRVTLAREAGLTLDCEAIVTLSRHLGSGRFLLQIRHLVFNPNFIIFFFTLSRHLGSGRFLLQIRHFCFEVFETESLYETSLLMSNPKSLTRKRKKKKFGMMLDSNLQD